MSISLGHYFLADDGETPVRCTLMQWAFWMECHPALRIVRQTRYRRGGRTWFISTVFLGLDHNFSEEEGAPVLWETMIFGPDRYDQQARYCSYTEAVRGHGAAFEDARKMAAQ